MKTLLGLHFMTPNEACHYTRDAVDIWHTLLHDGFIDWEGVRRCLQYPISSPFLIRNDLEKHLLYNYAPTSDHLFVAYRTREAESLILRMQDVANTERVRRFKEHFYTALSL